MAVIHKLTLEERLMVLYGELDYFRYKLNVIQQMIPHRNHNDEMLGDLHERETFYESEIKRAESRIKNLIDYGETPDFWKNHFTQTLIIYTDGN